MFYEVKTVPLIATGTPAEGWALALDGGWALVGSMPDPAPHDGVIGYAFCQRAVFAPDAARRPPVALPMPQQGAAPW